MIDFNKELIALAKAKGMPEWQFKNIIRNSNDALRSIKQRRIDHRWAKQGWSMNKGKTLRSQTGMSVGAFLLLQDRYFPETADSHERIKLEEELMRRHSVVMTHE